MNINDENFIIQLRKRNEKALDYVINNYGWVIKSIVKKEMYNLKYLQEECINDILLGVWNNINSFDEKRGEFKNWLGGITKFKCIDYKRRYLKDITYENIDDICLTDNSVRQTIEKECNEGMQQILNCLNEQDRNIFYSLYIEQEGVDKVSRDTGIKKDIIYNYKKEIGETAVDKNIEIKINDVMLDDENNLIISREIKSDKKIKEIPYGSSEDIYINDNKVEFRWNCISDEIIDDYSSATVDKYTLWSEDGDIDFGGDINIKIVYKEVGEYPDYTQGTWEFEFNCDNIHNLVEVTKKGGVNYKFKVDNGGEISLDTYKINPLDMIIYGRMEGEDKNNPYIIELRGIDDKGNNVRFKLSGGSDHVEMSPCSKIDSETKILKLTPYAMKFPKKNEKPEDMVKVGEEFTINLDK